MGFYNHSPLNFLYFSCGKSGYYVACSIFTADNQNVFTWSMNHEWKVQFNSFFQSFHEKNLVLTRSNYIQLLSLVFLHASAFFLKSNRKLLHKVLNAHTYIFHQLMFSSVQLIVFPCSLSLQLMELSFSKIRYWVDFLVAHILSSQSFCIMYVCAFPCYVTNDKKYIVKFTRK